MKMFAFRSYTNYGETVLLVNAVDEDTARAIAKTDNRVWNDSCVEEVSTTEEGVVFFGGGE